MSVEQRTYTFRPGSVGGWMDKYERGGLHSQANPVWRCLIGEAFALGVVPTETILYPARLSPLSVMERA
jgi:hypothetical protein